MAFSLRDAVPADLDAIMSIEHSVFPVDAWPAATMGAELGSAHGRYVVAIDDAGEIVGYAGLRAVGEQGDIQTIAVRPESRRLGIARAMLLELLAEARRRRVAEVLLEVRADNPGATALYESLGFARLAVRPRYYPPAAPADPPVDALVMRLDRRGLRAAAAGRTKERG
ncbi:MAG TPA: ribosomal protein S18-alanine N-acetyltransferase [Microbacteriaceae bacterium]|nr:ribosomal protein S18-alanine N-acetyltransferase [Microbacteriaceae bacterium]